MAKKGHNKHALNDGTRCIDYLLVYKQVIKLNLPKAKMKGERFF